MAKDPAFLFYPGDWLGGTMSFTRHEKGAYMDILMAQFNSGHLSLQDVKDILRRDFDKMWPQKLSKKFLVDNQGLFYNERLDIEVSKRKKFTDSQAERVKNRWQKPKKNEYPGITAVDTTVLPMYGNTFLENENENNSSTKNLELEQHTEPANFENFPTMPGEQNLNLELPKLKVNAATEIFKLAKNHLLTKEQTYIFWGVFKAQNFTGKKFYSDVGAVYEHFINWIKKQEISQNGNETNSTNNGKLGTSAARIKALKDW